MNNASEIIKSFAPKNEKKYFRSLSFIFYENLFYIFNAVFMH